MPAVSQNDISGTAAAVRNVASNCAAANREPSDAETAVLLYAAVDLVEGALINLARVAEALEHLAAKG